MKDIDKKWDSEPRTKTSAAFTDDMSIISSGLGSEVSDELQVRKGGTKTSAAFTDDMSIISLGLGSEVSQVRRGLKLS